MTGPDGNTYKYQYDPMSNLGTMQYWNANCDCWSTLASASYNRAGERTSLSYGTYPVYSGTVFRGLFRVTRPLEGDLKAAVVAPLGRS
jgi:hypothetical protein